MLEDMARTAPEEIAAASHETATESPEGTVTDGLVIDEAEEELPDT